MLYRVAVCANFCCHMWDKLWVTRLVVVCKCLGTVPASWNVVQGCPQRGKEKKRLRNGNRNECSRGRSLLYGHGTFSNSKVGGWWLVAVGGRWRLAVVDGRQLMVAGGWRLAVGGWRLVAVGSGWRLAVAGGWWLVVPGGLSLRAVLNKRKDLGS